MRTFKVIVLVVAFTLLMTAAASAADLFTPPVLIGATESASCDLVNVSAQSRTVNVELINESGVAVLQGGPAVLAPGQVRSTGAGGLAVSDRFIYCHWAVEGEKINYRAAIKRHSDLNGDILALPAE